MDSSTLTSPANVRLSHYEDCSQAMDGLFQDAVQQCPDTAFLDFLGFAEHFSGLSMYNAMLMRIQRPGAVAVAPATKWASVNRTIKPGATPLVLLRAFGPVSLVYELSDTEGEEIPGGDSNPLFATGNPCPRAYGELLRAADRNLVRVSYANHGSLAAGFAAPGHALNATACVAGRNEHHRWDVVINQNLDEPSRFVTLAHELGHVYCGHVGAHPKGAWPARKLSAAAAELEAEAVAWLVSNRNGVLTRSAQYLAEFATEAALAEISMFAIFEAANRVESRTERK